MPEFYPTNGPRRLLMWCNIRRFRKCIDGKSYFIRIKKKNPEGEVGPSMLCGIPKGQGFWVVEPNHGVLPSLSQPARSCKPHLILTSFTSMSKKKWSKRRRNNLCIFFLSPFLPLSISRMQAHKHAALLDWKNIGIGVQQGWPTQSYKRDHPAGFSFLSDKQPHTPGRRKTKLDHSPRRTGLSIPGQ